MHFKDILILKSKWQTTESADRVYLIVRSVERVMSSVYCEHIAQIKSNC